jgi:Fe(3+) dicitrate transport protein
MKNQILFFVFTLFVTAQLVSAQQKGFRAEVVNTDGDAIFGAIIKEINNQFSGKTDKNGYVTIEGVEPGKYNVIISADGFEELIKQIQVRSISAPEIHFVLRYEAAEMPQIEIVDRKNGLFSNTPGAVSVMTEKQLREINPLSGNEVFRQMPGVHAVDEEGLGLRVNVGIRGLDPDRSRSVLVLEDGIPVALAPYGEPEMYYTPTMDRMAGVEVLKGSGSILHGPQTIGGVINYVTKDPPAKESATMSLTTGSGGLFSGLATYGNTYGKTGVMVSMLHKRADEIGMLNFSLTDITGKLRFQTSEKSAIGVKFGFYDEVSNATYIGLTQSMYDMGGFDFARIAPDDQLKVRRVSASVTHDYVFNQKSKLKTTAFAYTTTRNWRRQDFVSNNLDADGNVSNYPSNFSGTIWGDTTIAGGALLMRNQTGNRNRQFEVAGIQSNFIHKYTIASVENELIVGGRFLFERAFEQRVNGTVPSLSSGVLRDEEIRTGFGTSAYAHNQFKINSRFSVTAGVRAELFDYERRIERANNKDSLIVNDSRVFQIIPGAGMNYKLNEHLVAFTGVHRGFAPPRIKDAISNSGEDIELDAELSWNYELGARGQLTKGINFELTGFYMDFSNQIIPVSESSGGTGAGLINAGRTLHAGVELGTIFNIHDLINLKGEKIYINANYTWVKAEFSADRFASDTINVRGNRTPYAPEHLISGGLTYESKYGFGARISYLYVSEQFTDIRNTIEPSAHGRNGRIDAYNVFDATLMYKVKKWNTTFTLSAKNFTDERYIASRRPQGIRVGNPRLLTFGVRWAL